MEYYKVKLGSVYFTKYCGLFQNKVSDMEEHSHLEISMHTRKLARTVYTDYD